VGCAFTVCCMLLCSYCILCAAELRELLCVQAVECTVPSQWVDGKVDFLMSLTDVNKLRDAGRAYDADAPLPDNPTPANIRFMFYRHVAAAFLVKGARIKYVDGIRDCVHAIWPDV
jgi:hypothetical protein